MSLEELLTGILGVRGSWLIELSQEEWEGKVWAKLGKIVKAVVKVGEVELRDLEALKFLLKKSSQIDAAYLKPLEEEVESSISVDGMTLFELIGEIAQEEEVKKRIKGVVSQLFKEGSVRVMELLPAGDQEVVELSKRLKESLEKGNGHYAFLTQEEFFSLLVKREERELLLVVSRDALDDFKVDSKEIVERLKEALTV